MTRTPVLGVTIALGLVSSSALAQNYTFSESTANYVPLSGATNVNPSSIDDGAALVTLPFPFTYYGTTFSAVNVGVNGALSFAKACPAAACDSSETCSGGFCTRSFMPLSSVALPSTSQQ